MAENTNTEKGVALSGENWSGPKGGAKGVSVIAGEGMMIDVHDAQIIPEEGRHAGVSNERYHQHFLAWNHSSARKIEPESMIDAHESIGHPDPEAPKATDAKVRGSAFHCAICEPDDFSTRYAEDPTDEFGGYKAGWRNTKAYRAAVQEIRAKDQQPLIAEDIDKAHRIQKMLHTGNSDGVKALRACTEFETVYVGRHPIHREVLMKCRFDGGAPEEGFSLELKTSESIGRFYKNVDDLGYDTANAWYKVTADAAGFPQFKKQWTLFVQTTGRLDFCLYEMIPTAVELGMREIDRWIPQIAEAIEKKKFEGFPKTLQPLDVKPWRYMQEERDHG